MEAWVGLSITLGNMRILKNDAERLFQEYAERQGWRISKRGWPDFIVEVDGELMAVEVKPDRIKRAKREQRRVMGWLNDHGIKAMVWKPSSGNPVQEWNRERLFKRK